MSTTRQTHYIDAPPVQVYRALLDPLVTTQWRVPDGMHGAVHEFEPWEGGRFRVSLTYDAPTGAGKSSPQADTYTGHFAQLVPNERVVEVLHFDSADPQMQGEMRITTDLEPMDAGTQLTVVHEGVPPGVDPAANATGWEQSLGKLAKLLAPVR